MYVGHERYGPWNNQLQVNRSRAHCFNPTTHENTCMYTDYMYIRMYVYICILCMYLS